MFTDTAEARIEYVRGVMRRLSLSDYALAKLCDLSHTTLLGIDEEPSKKRPTRRTVDRIAEKTGIPYGVPGAAPQADLAPDEPAIIVVEHEPATIRTAVMSLVGARKNAHPWLLRADDIAAFGYRAGDILVVDLDEAPRDGDVVCAQVRDFDRMRARTVFRVYDGGYLLSGSSAPVTRLPLPVVAPSVTVMGVSVGMVRVRRPIEASAS